MTWVATAVIGSAVIGAVATNRAGSKGTKALEEGQDILRQSRDQARQDVLRLFPEAQQAQERGFEQGRQFLTEQVLPQQAGLFQAGNVAAQNQLLGGLQPQISAITGQPIDLSGLQAQQFQQPSFDLGGFGAQPAQAQQQPTQITPEIQAQITKFLQEGGLAGVGLTQPSSFLPQDSLVGLPNIGANIVGGINPNLSGLTLGGAGGIG